MRKQRSAGWGADRQAAFRAAERGSLGKQRLAWYFRDVRSALLATVLAAVACERDPAPAPQPTASASAQADAGPCPGGRSLDPRLKQFKPAQLAFRDQQYDLARELLQQLALAYPHSASVRVWQGDVELFDRDTPDNVAADRALPLYRRAEALHDQGCALPEYERYYLRLDLALAFLRKRDGEAAVEQLKHAEREFGGSSNVQYNLARGYCRMGDLARCVASLERAFELARQLERPRFVRTHYTLSHWLSRSRTQSEFELLRRDPRYAALVREYSRE